MPKTRVPNNIIKIVKAAYDENLSLPISQRAAYKDENGKRVPGTGMRTARRLMSGAVDLAQLRLMLAWFARHGASEKESKQRQDKTSKASRAWRLWGGSSGLRWAKQAAKELETKE